MRRERAQNQDPLSFERRFMEEGFCRIAGVDEAGRGCLAGPVVAAAVILPRGCVLDGVTDSKLLSPPVRERLFDTVLEQAVAVGIGVVGPEEIDSINVLRASLKAMTKAVDALDPRPDLLLIDGNQSIPHYLPQKAIVQGDRLSLSISAASIVAKVYRDRLMERYHDEYPCYNFARHKGYGTREHREALRRWGVSPIHRKSFKGVREWVEQAGSGAQSSADGRSGLQKSIF